MSSSRILIVDDDPELLIALSGALRLRMPEVIVDTCDSAAAAVEKVSCTEYDAVVSDIKMPGMDGLALLKEVRDLEPDLPTLLVTGHGQHDLAVRALRGGAFDFIQKPIERDYFVASLARAIRVRKLDRQVQQHQQALEDRAGELERAVELRTRELLESNRRKDEFLAMLSHELRNPLACILTSAELALHTDESAPSMLEPCRVIIQQAHHMSRLLNDLLDLSRINRNKIELRKSDVFVNDVLNDAITAARAVIGEPGDRLKLNVDPVLREQRVHADRTRLEQVVVNLLNNAAKYSDADSEIRFSARREDLDIVIRVEDDGVGIAAGELPHIFEPFTQADSTLDRSKGGLGVGLALVRQLVQLHGGSVMAASDGVGCGSCFTVRLPIAIDSQASEPTPPEYSPVRAPARRILLVEDQEGLARLTRMLLERDGQQVVATAADGPSAIEAALTHRPDLILLDIGLPGMSGYEVARQLREFPQLDRTTLVAMTGYGSPEDQQRAREAGFDQHLVKPCSFQTLAECLRQPERSTALRSSGRAGG